MYVCMCISFFQQRRWCFHFLILNDCFFFFFFFSVLYFEMLGIKLCKELKLNGCFEGTILIISNFRVERALLRIARFYRFGFSFPYLFIYDWCPNLDIRWLYLYMLVLFLLNTKRALSSCCFFAAHIYLQRKEKHAQAHAHARCGSNCFNRTIWTEHTIVPSGFQFWSDPSSSQNNYITLHSMSVFSSFFSMIFISLAWKPFSKFLAYRFLAFMFEFLSAIH